MQFLKTGRDLSPRHGPARAAGQRPRLQQPRQPADSDVLALHSLEVAIALAGIIVERWRTGTLPVTPGPRDSLTLARLPLDFSESWNEIKNHPRNSGMVGSRKVIGMDSLGLSPSGLANSEHLKVGFWVLIFRWPLLDVI